MTELHFKGKEFVYNHHLTVPHRPLEMHPEKGIGDPRLDGNLIVQGDNLQALKALLPIYAGKVDCIFIDPPYNTGNEGWAYNDNVNAPMIKEWLEANPIGIDDGLRHDKWCAMMWPRLRLLRELLAQDGMIAVTLDDNEQHNCISIMDAIFGIENRVANISWVKRYTRSNNAKRFYSMKDQMLVYRASEAVEKIKEPRTESADEGYSNPDQDPNGPWITSSYVNPALKEDRKNLVYPINRPSDQAIIEHPTHAWKYQKSEHERHVAEKRLWWGQDGKAEYPRLKLYLEEASEMVPVDVWDWREVGSSDDGGHTLKAIFGGEVFDNPKPVQLIKKFLTLNKKKDALVLDSFAGSGTTAHAVLEANKRDGGSRRFILVEMEDYADRLTAERVRRVMNGYDFTGTQKTELHREKLNWSKLQKADKIADTVEKIENLHGHEFDKVKKTIEGGELIVTGEKRVGERAEGLGGEFTYCTLGDPIEMDKILTGETLPSFVDLATVLFHTATNLPGDPAVVNAETFFMGEANGQMLWLVYKPELDWLKTPEAAMSLSFAREIVEKNPKAQHLVFAPANHTNPKMLAKEGLKVEFAPLPYALYRVEKA